MFHSQWSGVTSVYQTTPSAQNKSIMQRKCTLHQ